MIKFCSRLVFCLALWGGWCGAGGAAHAATMRYDFSGSFWDAGGGTGYLPLRFGFDWPGFIGIDTSVAPDAMLYCHLGGLAGASCDSARFVIDSKAAGYTPDSLNALLFSVRYADGASAESAYYFPLGTFGSTGTFAAGGNPGALAIGAVPEPAAWLGWLTGLAVLGWARRQAGPARLPFLQRISACGRETGKMSASIPYPPCLTESHHDDHRSRRNQRRRHQSQSDRKSHAHDAAIPRCDFFLTSFPL